MKKINIINMLSNLPDEILIMIFMYNVPIFEVMNTSRKFLRIIYENRNIIALNFFNKCEYNINIADAFRMYYQLKIREREIIKNYIKYEKYTKKEYLTINFIKNNTYYGRLWIYRKPTYLKNATDSGNIVLYKYNNYKRSSYEFYYNIKKYNDYYTLEFIYKII